MVHIEDYFDFLRPDDIRIRGHRIGIESILDQYVRRHRSPEQIQRHFPTLSLEQIYATVLYYLQNREAVGAYLEEWLEYGQGMREEQARDPSPGALKLRALLKERCEPGASAE